jgi:hypothetical protein
MFEDLIVELEPPTNRRGKCSGETERHLTEAAVMLAYAMHLLRTVPGLTTIELHPDGEHAKRFEIGVFCISPQKPSIQTQATRVAARFEGRPISARMIASTLRASGYYLVGYSKDLYR